MSEREQMIAVLVEEYVAVLRHEGSWGAMGLPDAFRWGGREALRRVAERIGVTNLHDQATDRLAREGSGDARQH